jgi:phosphatidylglycerophosphatase A
MLLYPAWQIMLLGLILFRFFDIVKPMGIRSLQRLDGGRGIVFDDLAAAIYTCLVLHVWIGCSWPPFTTGGGEL